MKKTGLTALRQIGMGAVSILLQPIFEVTGERRELHALECLIRGPKGSRLETPDALFEFVKEKETDLWFDRTCVKLGLESVGALPGQQRVSINIHASVFRKDPSFTKFVEDLAWGNAIAPSRVTIEIAEYGAFADNPAIVSTVRELRAIGIKIALDDSGLGPDFGLLLDVKPDYLKLDRALVQGLAAEESKRAILDGLLSLSKSLGFRIVAEGIETAEQLRFVTTMGVNLVQGFFLGEPVPASAFRDGVLLGGGGGWNTKRTG